MQTLRDTCAFCGKRKGSPGIDGQSIRITREHLLPDALVKAFAQFNSQFFAQRKRPDLLLSHFQPDLVVIKDVCNQCNNGPLSVLDQYAADWLRNNASHRLSEKSRLKLSVNGESISRWLLKLIYNSDRAAHGGRRQPSFKELAPYMLGVESRPPSVTIGVGTVATHILTKEEKAVVTKDVEELAPAWIRIGGMEAGAAQDDVIQKFVQCGALMFLLVVFRLESTLNEPREQLRLASKEWLESKGLVELRGERVEELHFGPPAFDAVDVMRNHFDEYSDVYRELYRDSE